MDAKKENNEIIQQILSDFEQNDKNIYLEDFVQIFQSMYVEFPTLEQIDQDLLIQLFESLTVKHEDDQNLQSLENQYILPNTLKSFIIDQMLPTLIQEQEQNLNNMQENQLQQSQENLIVNQNLSQQDVLEEFKASNKKLKDFLIDDHEKYINEFDRFKNAFDNELITPEDTIYQMGQLFSFYADRSFNIQNQIILYNEEKQQQQVAHQKEIEQILESKNQEIEDLKLCLQMQQIYEKKGAIFNQEKQQLELQVKDLNQKLKQLEKELSNKQDEFTLENDQIKQKLHQSQQEIFELKETIKMYQQTHDTKNENMENIINEHNQLKKQIENKDNQIQKLNDEIKIIKQQLKEQIESKSASVFQPLKSVLQQKQQNSKILSVNDNSKNLFQSILQQSQFRKQNQENNHLNNNLLQSILNVGQDYNCFIEQNPRMTFIDQQIQINYEDNQIEENGLQNIEEQNESLQNSDLKIENNNNFQEKFDNITINDQNQIQESKNNNKLQQKDKEIQENTEIIQDQNEKINQITTNEKNYNKVLDQYLENSPQKNNQNKLENPENQDNNSLVKTTYMDSQQFSPQNQQESYYSDSRQQSMDNDSAKEKKFNEQRLYRAPTKWTMDIAQSEIQIKTYDYIDMIKNYKMNQKLAKHGLKSSDIKYYFCDLLSVIECSTTFLRIECIKQGNQLESCTLENFRLKSLLEFLQGISLIYHQKKHEIKIKNKILGNEKIMHNVFIYNNLNMCGYLRTNKLLVASKQTFCILCDIGILEFDKPGGRECKFVAVTSETFILPLDNKQKQQYGFEVKSSYKGLSNTFYTYSQIEQDLWISKLIQYQKSRKIQDQEINYLIKKALKK